MKTYSLLLFLLLALMSSKNSEAQTPEVLQAYQPRTFISADGDTLLYRILYPENYDVDHHKKYPLLLFLHGAGERGSDNQKQLVHGASLFLEPVMRKEFPAIVVFPQCPAGSSWANYRKIMNEEEGTFSDEVYPPTAPMALVMALHDQLVKKERVNKDRLYVMGLSMGGFGTFDILARKPETFAAAVPICGGGNPGLARRYASHTALWITHGAQDNVVPVENSRRMYQALKELGADVRYTEFPDAGHNAWDATFEMMAPSESFRKIGTTCPEFISGGSEGGEEKSQTTTLPQKRERENGCGERKLGEIMEIFRK